MAEAESKVKFTTYADWPWLNSILFLGIYNYYKEQQQITAASADGLPEPTG